MLQRLCFRWADEQDVKGAVALVQRAYRGEPSRMGWTTEADLLDGQRTDRHEVGALVEDERGHSRVLLAQRGPQPVACAALSRPQPHTVCVGLVAVEPSMQGVGIGRLLLGEAERRVVEEGLATHMRMTVIAQRPELIAWYARCGYLPTGEREPFPYGQPRFGLPRRPDLYFVVLDKRL